jgi:hypothetical protein
MPATKSNSSSSSTKNGRPRYSKWIESPDEHADRKGQSLATQSHEVIQQWAGERKVKPATIESQQDDPRVLRFDFPGYGGRRLVEIGWDAWFRTFDDRNVTFIYQEQLRNGNQSNFFKLDDGKAGGSRSRTRRAA